MPTVLKQTTKQAKAAFKARGRPSLTEKEQRQLERSIELEQRVEKIKEGEKRRAEAAKKRQEKESREKLGRGNMRTSSTAQLGSQRRCDRFGYKSSQFHLGAFFGKRSAPAEKQTRMEAVEEDEEDAFGDDGLDDDSLLEALHGPVIPQSQSRLTKATRSPETAASLVPPPPLPARPAPPQPNIDVAVTSRDMDDFCAELESSTQVARELGHQDEYGVTSGLDTGSKSGSFSSGSLDLTVEDLEALDPPKTTMPPPAIPIAKARTNIPPPARPVSLKLPTGETDKQRWQQKPPCRASASAVPKRVQSAAKQSYSGAIRGAFLPASSLHCSQDLGFTATQLETFIDDDIQLTQMTT